MDSNATKLTLFVLLLLVAVPVSMVSVVTHPSPGIGVLLGVLAAVIVGVGVLAILHQAKRIRTDLQKYGYSDPIQTLFWHAFSASMGVIVVATLIGAYFGSTMVTISAVAVVAAGVGLAIVVSAYRRAMAIAIPGELDEDNLVIEFIEEARREYMFQSPAARDEYVDGSLWQLQNSSSRPMLQRDASYSSAE